MNQQEREAKDAKYFDSFIPSYEPLWNKREKKFTVATASQKPFWSLLGKYQYMIFESLYYLYRQLENKNGPNIDNSLPEFMSALLMAYPIEEYCFRILKFFFDYNKNTFIRGNMSYFFKKEYRHNKFAQHIRKMAPQHLSQQEANDISLKFKKLKFFDQLRNKITHVFRLLWWKNTEAGLFGFPRIIMNQNSLIKEAWKSIQNTKEWEKNVEELEVKKFLSGREIIRDLHENIAKLAESIFKLLIQKIGEP